MMIAYSIHAQGASAGYSDHIHPTRDPDFALQRHGVSAELPYTTVLTMDYKLSIQPHAAV